MQRWLSLFSSLLLSAAISAQIAVQGEVRDAQNGAALPGARIEVHESGLISASDSNGVFRLRLKRGNYHLHITANGYQATDLDLKARRDTFLIFRLEPTFLELQEVLVEDSYNKTQQSKSSQPVEMIRLSEGEGALESSLAEALEKTPGLNAYNTGVGIAKPMIRGFTGTRVAVFDQGIKQEGQQWGMDHGLEIDPFNVQAVEIIKGPGALQYGSDAISGVMKVLPTPFPKGGFSGSYSGIYKSNNNSLGNSLRLAYRKQNQFISGRLSHQRYEDFRIPADEFTYNGFVLPVVDNRLKNTAGELLSGRFNYGLTEEGYNLRLMLSHYQQQVGLYPGAMGIPRAYDVRNIGPTDDIDLPNQKINHSKAYLKLNVKIGDNWLVTDLGWQQNSRRENSRPHTHGFQEIDDDDVRALGLDLNTWSLNSKYDWRAHGLSVSLGTNQQWQKNRRSGWEYLLPDFQRYNGGLFGMVEGAFRRAWQWNAGLRFDYAHHHSQNYQQPWYNDLDSLVERSPALQRNFFNYSLALGSSYQLSDFWNFKLNLARSFRVPVPAELVANGIHHGTFRHEVGSPDLDSEVGYQADLGISYTRKDLYLRLTPFFNYFENFLFLRPAGTFSVLPDAGQLYRYSEAEALHAGTELFLEYHPVKALHLATALEYVYNYNLESGLPLPFTPPLSNLLSAEYQLINQADQRWSVGVEHRWTADQNRVDRNEATTPGYHLLHARLNYQKTFKPFTLNLSLQVQNIFNTAYLQHLSRYRILNLSEQGRNIILALNLKF